MNNIKETIEKRIKYLTNIKSDISDALTGVVLALTIVSIVSYIVFKEVALRDTFAIELVGTIWIGGMVVAPFLAIVSLCLSIMIAYLKKLLDESCTHPDAVVIGVVKDATINTPGILKYKCPDCGKTLEDVEK